MKKESNSLALFNILIAVRSFSEVPDVEDIELSLDETTAYIKYTDGAVDAVDINHDSVIFTMKLVIDRIFLHDTNRRIDVLTKELEALENGKME